MKKRKMSVGHKFENKVKRILGIYNIERGTSSKNKKLKKIPKEPDFLIMNKRDKPKIAIECKYTSEPQKAVRYWTLFSRGYVLLHILKIKYPNIKCFLVFNAKNKDKMDYYNICKKAKINFISLKDDKTEFLRKLRGLE
ncbi:hypothetical protein HYW99_01155 [Candidatus Woesearchaeota archaeon]|nr:hypothetical protein [Candidatus Woesearchaeota archaeon]